MTPKQTKFVAEYRVDHNATQAAIRAGYSTRSASTLGERLLRNKAIAAAVAVKDAKALEQLEITAERVLEEIARCAFVTADELYNPDGSVKPINQMSIGARSAIAQLSILKKNVTAGDGLMDTVLQVRLVDKARALELLAKRFGLLKERVEVTGLDDIVERLTRARARVKK